MRKILISIFASICFFVVVNKVQAQCGPYYTTSPDANCGDCAVVSLPGPINACPGVGVNVTPVVTVPAGFTVRRYRWTPAGSVATPTGAGVPGSTTITPVPPAIPPAPCSIVAYSYSLSVTALAPNVVADGDFSGAILSPPSGSFCAQPTPAMPAVLTSSQYTICSDANLVPSYIPIPGGYPASFGDHTSGTGNMLIALADFNVNIIWQQDVMICPGAEYEFSFWQACLHSHVGYPFGFADMYVTIEDAGTVLYTSGPFSNAVSGLYDNWDQHVMSWINTTGATTATIYLHAGGPIPGAGGTQPMGTTYLIDDISLNRICKSTDDITINVSYPDISGPTRVCVGSTIALSSCSPGGVWTSGTTTIATVDASGVVTGVSAGTVDISYTDASGCIVVHGVRVIALPVISGPATVCAGGLITWSSAGGSGLWTTTGGLFGLGSGWGTTKMFTATSVGTAVITFTDSLTGCITTATVVVNDTPTITPPPAAICHTYMGLTLSASPAGGVWSTSNSAVAVINPATGQVTPTGSFFGSVLFTYTLPTGCSSDVWVEIRDCSGGGLGGWRECICPGSTRALTIAVGGAPAGGVWSSSNTSVATVDPVTGVVTGVGVGTTIITYTVGGVNYTVTMTGCASQSACVTTSFVGGDYVFTFTATSPGCRIYYKAFDFTGAYVGGGWTYAGTMTYTTMVSLLHTTLIYTVCVYRVDCNCVWEHEFWCCAHVNPLPGVAVPGIEDRTRQLSVVPNPNAGSFELEGLFPDLAQEQNVVVDIVDMLGRTVYSAEATITNGKISKSLRLDNSVANGVYMLRVKNDNVSKTIRFEMQR